MGAHKLPFEESQYVATPFYWLLCNQMPTSRGFSNPQASCSMFQTFCPGAWAVYPVKQGEKFFQSFQWCDLTVWSSGEQPVCGEPLLCISDNRQTLFYPGSHERCVDYPSPLFLTPSLHSLPPSLPSYYTYPSTVALYPGSFLHVKRGNKPGCEAISTPHPFIPLSSPIVF